MSWTPERRRLAATPEGRRALRASRRPSNSSEHWLTPGASPERAVIVQCDRCGVQGTGEVRRGKLVRTNLPQTALGARLIHSAVLYNDNRKTFEMTAVGEMPTEPRAEATQDAARRTAKACGGTLAPFDVSSH